MATSINSTEPTHASALRAMAVGLAADLSPYPATDALFTLDFARNIVTGNWEDADEGSNMPSQLLTFVILSATAGLCIGFGLGVALSA
jgi:hypothetical protein